MNDPVWGLKPPKTFQGRWAFGCGCGFGLETAGTFETHCSRVLGHLRNCGLHRHHATTETAVYQALVFLESFVEDDQKPLLQRAIRERRSLTPKVQPPRCGMC